MTERDLQRLTISMVYIDHEQNTRRAFFVRRHYITVRGIATYPLLTRLRVLTQQCRFSLNKPDDLLTEAKSAPCGPMSGHDRLTSFPELIGPPLLIE